MTWLRSLLEAFRKLDAIKDEASDYLTLNTWSSSVGLPQSLHERRPLSLGKRHAAQGRSWKIRAAVTPERQQEGQRQGPEEGDEVGPWRCDEVALPVRSPE